MTFYAEINLAGREARRRGLGPANDGVSAGIFLLPVTIFDSETEAALDLLDAKIWIRSDEYNATPVRERPLEGKESVRWLDRDARAAERLPDATSVLVVADHESDTYAGFAKPLASFDLIVFSERDRALNHSGRLFAAPRLGVS